MAPQPGRNLTLAAVVASALVAPPAAAQFRVETRVVLVDVSVSRDGPVHGLTEDDFELRVGGAPVPFRMLEPESVPLVTLFAMDVSASTAGDRRRRLATGARRFTEAMTARDVCGVVAFSSEARFVRGFESCELGVGDDVLARSPGGATAIWDGVILSLAALHGRREHPLLLVFTDGEDNLSWVGESQVRRAARASDVLIYAILTLPPRMPRETRGESPGTRLLREVSEGSGGRTITIRSDAGLEDAFGEILEDLRVRYVLAFTPDPERQGFVPIEVEVDRPRVRIRAREGYTARP